MAAKTGAEPISWRARTGLMVTTVLIAVWAVGVVFRLGVSVIPLRRVRHLLATATVVDAPAMLALASEISNRLKLSGPPTLLVTTASTEPLAVSHWNNIVLLSQADFERLSTDELRAILAHEFAHIRRADLWLGLVPLAAQIAFWFFPFAWLACREFSLSREAACDALAVQSTHTAARDYGMLLLKLGTPSASLGPAVALGSTADFHTLQRRIIMMHQMPRCSGARLHIGLTALFVPVVALGLIPWRIVSAHPARIVGGRVFHQDSESGLPKAPSNLNFSKGLEGWNRSTHDGEENYFDSGLDTGVTYHGVASPFLYATANLPKIYGVLTQWVSADAYHGKRIRLTGYIRTRGVKDYGGLMLGVVGGAHAKTYLLEKQPLRGDTDWMRVEFVTDVPSDARALVFGMNLQGKGKVWMNDLALDVVGTDVPVSPDNLVYSSDERPAGSTRSGIPPKPVNLDFTRGLRGWASVEEGDESKPTAYHISKEHISGHPGVVACLTSDGSQPNGYGTMVQYINPAAYRGKRVRLTALIKTVDVEKYAGLWIGEEGPQWTVWDAEHAEVKAPAEWTEVSLVVDVSKACSNFGLGAVVRGPGKLYIDHFTFAVVGDDVPVSPVTLKIDSNE
jgi:beta-lactamase regulating signal transducer with metallopeptidase domain